MPHMLGMAAFQVRHPVIEIILMKADNCPFNCHDKTTTNGPALK